MFVFVFYLVGLYVVSVFIFATQGCPDVYLCDLFLRPPSPGCWRDIDDFDGGGGGLVRK